MYVTQSIKWHIYKKYLLYKYGKTLDTNTNQIHL